MTLDDVHVGRSWTPASAGDLSVRQRLRCGCPSCKPRSPGWSDAANCTSQRGRSATTGGSAASRNPYTGNQKGYEMKKLGTSLGKQMTVDDCLSPSRGENAEIFCPCAYAGASIEVFCRGIRGATASCGI